MTGFHPLEKKILAASLAFAAVSLALIGYAAYALGIDVPDCVTDREPFTEGQVISHAPDRYEVHLVAKMWAFDPPVIRVPKGATVDFYVSSPDVTHGLHIERTNVNLMAVPGVVNRAQTRFTKPGRYAFACHEYCGVGHQDMYAHVEVVDGDVTDAPPAIANVTPSAVDMSKIQAMPGFTLYSSKGCVACHSLDGSKMVGPTFRGLFGEKRAFEDGGSAEADEAYLRVAIREPGKHIVKGYAAVMPPMPLTDDELTQLVELIKALR
jgi:cytochrome c oxidase subunit 2